MANFAKSHANVVGLALRNELRAVGSQDGNNHADWYNFVAQGANAVHSTNANLLIPIGGACRFRSSCLLSFPNFHLALPSLCPGAKLFTDALSQA